MQNRIILAALLLVSLGSFRAQKAPHQLEGRNWYLKTVYKDDGYTMVMMKKAYISFNPGSDRAGGDAGCNRFGASLYLDGDTVKFDKIISTKMYCSDVQSIEDDFLKQLRRVNRYEIKEGKLLLYKDEVLLLEFAE